MTQERKTLKQLREERGLTQLELTRELGVSLSMISGIESRRNQPGIVLGIKIAQYFGVAVEAINWPSDEEVRAKSKRGKVAA